MGAFHWTKISGNPGSKSNGTDISRKFVSKISVHLSRLSFFLEIWKFQKFPVPIGISTGYEYAPVLLAVKSYKMAASLSSRHYTGCKIMCHSSSLFVILFWKIVNWSFRISWGLIRSVCILPRHTFPREKFASCSHHAKMVFESVR